VPILAGKIAPATGCRSTVAGVISVSVAAQVRCAVVRARAPLRIMPNFATHGASRRLPRCQRSREKFCELSVDLFALRDEVLRAGDLVVDRHGSLRGDLVLTREVGFDEGALVVGEVAVHIAILVLADDLGIENAVPPMRARAIAVQRDEVTGLRLVRGVFALEREVMATAPMAPSVPSAEGVVHFRIAVDRLLGPAAPDEHRLMGVEVGDEFLVGLRRFFDDEKAAWEQAMRGAEHGGVELDIERDLVEVGKSCV